MGDRKFTISSSSVLWEGTLRCWSQLHLQLLAPINSTHWARVVGYGLFSLCVIHKEGLGLQQWEY
jgi:hypothetical protein